MMSKSSIPAMTDSAPVLTGEAAPPGREALPGSTEVLEVIPVIAESLDVGRRELNGAVRVHKRVVENLVNVDETVREEQVSVERVPIGRPVDGPVGIRHEGDVMIVPIVEERLVAERRLVLVEELHIRRQVRTHREPQQVRLRQEQVVVERLDPRTNAWAVVDLPIRTMPPTPASADPAAPPSGPAVAAPEASSTDAAIHGAADDTPR